jgi:CheY-like chemotaxis protein
MKGADNECRAAGMDDYLSKPIDRDQLQKALLHWLNDAGESSESEEKAAR